ncbi:MAG: DUF881 domain-containing protein [Dehalococcoidia bacterium]|nr:DUF881 domain-containing protein [Dehalococcoidia bacterium]
MRIARLSLTKWGLSLTIVLFVLGLLLSIQWNTEREKPAAADSRAAELYGITVKRLEDEQKQLKSNVERLQKETQAYQELAGLSKETMGELTDELRLQRIAAGLMSLKGPGVKVSLDDSKRSPAPGENPNLYIIHDYQVRDVVNLFWHGGAEAISINAERLVATSSIYSSGGTIMVNSTRLSPPFVIQALGDADKMMDLFRQPSSLRTLRAQSEAYGLVLNLQKEYELKVPAFSGSYAATYLNLGRP